MADDSALLSASCILSDNMLHTVMAAPALTLLFNLRSRVCTAVETLAVLAGQAICPDPESRIIWALNAATHTVTAYDPLLASLPNRSAESAPGVDLRQPEAVLLQPVAMLPAQEQTCVSPAALAVAMLATMDCSSTGRVSCLSTFKLFCSPLPFTQLCH